MEIAVFGGGCFWAIQHAFSKVEGVVDTRAGYMGGDVDHPTYAEVCDGNTGHIEVVEVEFDPSFVNYKALVTAFWTLHDPTSWDHQGHDVGAQYRSVIFVGNERQSETAEACLAQAADLFDEEIVTEIRDTAQFWVAEDDHQDFVERRGV